MLDKIENLKAQMQGHELNIRQRADALIEFNKLLEYTEELEAKVKNSRLHGVSGAFPTDEEIEKWAFKKYHELEKAAWFDPLIEGAKWMRSKIRIQ